jgi:8-amino-7-oxononanoate synthase
LLKGVDRGPCCFHIASRVLPSLQHEIYAELIALGNRHRLRTCPSLRGNTRIDVLLEGRKLVSFSSNDYLGLASDPRLRQAAADAGLRSGFGAGGSRLLCGTLPEHLAIESALASLVGFPSALVFPSGYQANLGAITALAGPDDLIVADRAVHASILDGCRLSRAKLAVYPHLDLQRADRHLTRLGAHARRRFVITESLFSMDGDIAPLRELASLAAIHDAALIVDEAHAIGSMGPRGSGLCAQLGVRPDVIIGTLGKAIGAAGAFVAGSEALCSLLINRARSYIYTTALPPPVAAAASASLQIIASPEGDLLRSRLYNAISKFRSAVRLSSHSNTSPILPLVFGTDQAALSASTALRLKGFFVQAIRPPTVREGSSRLRITFSALHTEEQVSDLAQAISELPVRPLSSISAIPRSVLTPIPVDQVQSPPQLHHPRNRGIFLAGTGTGVGKTAVASALLHLMVLRGLHPVPFKPVETGATPEPTDALHLRAASRRFDIPLSVICPYSFPQPIAPSAAATLAGVQITTPLLLSAARAATEFGDPLVVESAGGLLSPWGAGLTSADFAEAIGFPVLLVAGNSLGTVSDTALSVLEMRRRHLPLVGVVLVNTHPVVTPDQEFNASLIAELTGLSPLGTLPFVPSPSPPLLATALESSVDLSPVFASLAT